MFFSYYCSNLFENTYFQVDIISVCENVCLCIIKYGVIQLTEINKERQIILGFTIGKII